MKKIILGLLLLSGVAFGAAKIQNADIKAAARIVLSKLETIPTGSIVGNVSGSPGVPSVLNGQQLYSLISAYTVSDHGALTGLSDDDHPQYGLLAGRSGGQIFSGDSLNGGSVVLRSNPANNGLVTIGQSYKEIANGCLIFGDTSQTACATSVGSMFYATAGRPYWAYVSNGGQRWLVEPGNSNIQFNVQADAHIGFALDTSGRFFQYDASPTIGMARFANAGNTGTSSSSFSSQDAFVDVGNNDTTVGNHEGIAFTNGANAKPMIAALMGVNDNHNTAGTQTGHIEAVVVNAGVQQRAVSINADKTVTMDAYQSGIPNFDSSGKIGSVAAPPTNGGVLASQYGQWVPSIVAVPPCVALGSGVAVDWSLGNCFTKVLSGNATFTFSKRVAGQTIVMRITNPSTYTYTFPNTNTAGNSVLWAGSTIPSATGGGKKDIITIFYDGSEMYGVPTQNFGGF